jgi:hypothetical protein
MTPFERSSINDPESFPPSLVGRERIPGNMCGSERASICADVDGVKLVVVLTSSGSGETMTVIGDAASGGGSCLKPSRS